MSGLAAAQRAHAAQRFGSAPELLLGVDTEDEVQCVSAAMGEEGQEAAQATATACEPVVVGAPSNLLCETHPVFNIRPCKVRAALRAFGTLPCTHADLMSA